MTPDTDFKLVTLWQSYVGRGAPPNAAGSRSGLGRTKREASVAAGHHATQAPWEKFRRVTLLDRRRAPSLTTREEAAIWAEIELIGLSPRAEHVQAVAAATSLAHQGRVASAWLALHAAR